MAAELRNAPERREPALPQKLTLEQRERLTVTGVSEILRFDETTVVMRLEREVLTVRGQTLSLRQLAPDSGRVEVRGIVDQVSFEQATGKGGFFSRLFG